MIKTLLAATLAIMLAAGNASGQTRIEAAHPKGEVALVVDFEVKPGLEGEFEAYFARSTMCSRLESGNITFNIHKVVDAQGRYVLYEIWRSQDALESHLKRPYTVALFAMFDRVLVRPITEGGLRFIRDLHPAPRPAPTAGNAAECR